MTDITKKLAAFALWALETGPFDGCEVAGEDIQNKAQELGLIEHSRDRPDWWVYTPGFNAALSAGETASKENAK